MLLYFLNTGEYGLYLWKNGFLNNRPRMRQKIKRPLLEVSLFPKGGEGKRQNALVPGSEKGWREAMCVRAGGAPCTRKKHWGGILFPWLLWIAWPMNCDPDPVGRGRRRGRQLLMSGALLLQYYHCMLV